MDIYDQHDEVGLSLEFINVIKCIIYIKTTTAETSMTRLNFLILQIRYRRLLQSNFFWMTIVSNFSCEAQELKQSIVLGTAWLCLAQSSVSTPELHTSHCYDHDDIIRKSHGLGNGGMGREATLQPYIKSNCILYVCHHGAKWNFAFCNMIGSTGHGSGNRHFGAATDLT